MRSSPLSPSESIGLPARMRLPESAEERDADVSTGTEEKFRRRNVQLMPYPSHRLLPSLLRKRLPPNRTGQGPRPLDAAAKAYIDLAPSGQERVVRECLMKNIASLAPRSTDFERAERRLGGPQLFPVLNLGSRYKDLTALPPNLPRLQQLTLKNLTELRELPDQLEVVGDLTLSGCPNLRIIPPGTDVGGDVLIGHCGSLASFPARLANNGSLTLQGAFPFLNIPEALSVKNTFAVTYDPEREILFPIGAPPVVGALRLLALPRLHHLNLPASLAGSITIEDCRGLQLLARSLTVLGELRILSCENLLMAADNLNIGGNLDIKKCLRMALVSHVLEVKGNIEISQVSSLERVTSTVAPYLVQNPMRDTSHVEGGASLRVGGSVDISYGECFRGFDTRDFITQDLSVADCPQFDDLPTTLFGWTGTPSYPRRLTALRTGLRPMVHGEWVERSLSGVTVEFSVPSQMGLAAYDFKNAKEGTVEDLVQLFHDAHDSAAGGGHIRTQKWLTELDPTQKTNLYTFLRKLLDGPDLISYREALQHASSSLGSRELMMPVYRLIFRVSAFLSNLEVYPDAHDEVFYELAVAVAGCVDRVMTYLCRFEQYFLIRSAPETGPQKEAYLLELAQGLFRLDLTNQWVFQNASRFQLDLQESSELLFSLEQKCRRKFCLPIFAAKMRYPDMAASLNKVASEAIRDIKEASRDSLRFTSFLDAWEPWQHYQREVAASKIIFELLPKQPLKESHIEGTCPFSQLDFFSLKQPVFLPFAQTSHFYELEDLVTWWVKSPVHPWYPFQALPDLTALFRPA